MTLRNRMEHPTAWLRAGMAALLVSSLLQWLVHPATRAGENWMDAARGFFIALSLGFNVLWLRRSGSRTCGGEPRGGA
jgi:hypothetical protein